MCEAIFSHERKPFIRIGQNGDERNLQKVLSDLERIGYRRVREEWMLGGSQEFDLYRLARGRDKLVLQAETYEDMKLYGKRALLDEVQNLIRQK